MRTNHRTLGCISGFAYRLPGAVGGDPARKPDGNAFVFQGGDSGLQAIQTGLLCVSPAHLKMASNCNVKDGTLLRAKSHKPNVKHTLSIEK